MTGRIRDSRGDGLATAVKRTMFTTPTALGLEEWRFSLGS